MQDKDLYQQILGLKSPWTVSDVQLDHEQSEIRVQVDHARGTKFCCPECQSELSCHDHTEERRWRHLGSCQFKTILIARVPRVKCPTHGVKNANVPWAEKHSRFTIMFERFAIDVLLATQTVKGAMSILDTKWDQTWNIVVRAVRRGKQRKQSVTMPRIGIDEKAFKKGHSYITLLYDLDNSTVEAVSEGNDAEAAKACFSELSEDQIKGVEAIAMDMSAAFVKATKETIPLAENKIVHDRFHVMQLATKAVDKVRRGEHKKLKSEGDDRLTHSRYLWLKSQENLTANQRHLFDEIYMQQLQTGKASAYKEMLRDLWHHDDSVAATTFFNDWYKRVIHTKLEPMKTVARSIKERLANVVSYCTHRITNAVAEGMNSKIMSIKRRVGGFRNVGNFKTAVFFYCGGLDLYPR
ncbi:ISL3 family transposase [Roseiconus lacunae]|uniref:ISL3 family transposase n=1 Tax=Roseiconus lacunae TaxID=2605694 RepID=UPI0030893337|nr:ISL3 family transposase [Stieleria sp. HD01]